MRLYNILIAWLCLLVCPLVAEAQRSVAAAEYFIGVTDPGEGNGTALTAIDGNFNEALEEALVTSGVFSTAGPKKINVRMQNSSGDWSAVFSTVVTVDSELTAARSLNISQAEYFWGTTDPGQGNGVTLLAFDGNFNEALETAFANTVNLPSGTGAKKLNIRMQDAAGQWSSLFSVVVMVDGELTAARNLNIAQAEYFWGTTDPGQGNGTALLAFDGNFNEALETAFANAVNLPSSTGNKKLNIRMQDAANQWSDLFSVVVMVDGELTAARNLNISQAEYFWGTTDPGQGNGVTLLAFDGNFNEALETAFANAVNLPSGTGAKKLNIRMQDAANQWSDLFSVIVTVDGTLTAARNLNISQAEYFWGTTDPGQGNGTALLAFDGNFDEALEVAFANAVNLPSGTGNKKLNIRMQDATGQWSAIFSTILSVESPLGPPRTPNLMAGEVFWNTDPGQGNGTPLVAFDGNFDEALEMAEKTLGTTSLTAGPNKLSVRFQNENGWGNVFSVVVFVEGCTTTPVVSIVEGSPTTFCDGGSVLLSANKTFSAYTWLNEFGDTVSTASSFTATTGGSYTLTVDSSGCTGTSTASDVIVNLDPVNTDPADTVKINAYGLTAYYDLDGDALNSGGSYMTNGTISGIVTATDNYKGEAAEALDFDGSTGEINFGDIDDLNSTNSFTVSGWFKQDVLDVRGGMFAKILNSSNMIRSRTWTDGFMYVYVYNGGVSYGRFDYSQFVKAGEWFHFAMRYDGTASGNSNRLKVYVDGQEVSMSYVGTIPAVTANLSGIDFILAEDVNVATKGENWSGGIDQFRIYGTALPETDIQKLAFESLNPALLTSETVCVNSDGTIQIFPSQPGISYQLRDDSDNSNVGGALVGNGDTLSFNTGSLSASTTYNFYAFNASATGCNEDIDGTVTVNTATPPALTLSVIAQDDSLCSGTSTNIQIANSETGVSYQLRNNTNDANIGTAVTGTSSTIDLPTGNLTANITFNVFVDNGSCTAELTNTETVLIFTTPTVTNINPTTANVGDSITITGGQFAEVSSVAFNGTAAGFRVVSLTQIKAAVPAGVTTGKITVTTECGNDDSPQTFLPNTVNLNSGLIARYLLNGNGQDSLGNFNGTAVNPDTTCDRNNNADKAMAFSAGSYVDLGNVMDNVFAGAGKQFSFSVWVRPSSSTMAMK